MSARAEAHVLDLCEKHEELRPIHCHVLQLLAIRHDHECGIAWPSVARMAKESHYTERAIYIALDELTEWMLLHRSYGELPRKSSRQRPRQGNRYAFPGLDQIDEYDQPRLLGGRPLPSDDQGDEGGSPEPDDEEMNLTHAGDERDVTAQTQVDEPDAHVTPEQTSTLRVDYVRNGQAQTRAPDEAPPRRADEETYGDAVPPKWQELVPGVYRGRPGGQGEVSLLKVRCPICERSMPRDEIDDHVCVPVGEPIRPGVRAGNLANFLPRRPKRGAVPPEVQAELAAMADARRGAPTVDPKLLREHEAYLARARGQPVATPEELAP